MKMKKWYAVIGDPIAQSKSPAMHDEWLAGANLDATYVPLHVKKEQLKEAVESLKMLGCSGWNVTVPHKTTILPFLDAVDPMAEKMQAVNTVKVMPDGTLHGFNTDGTGFVRSLEEAFGYENLDGEVLLIGAGGAAHGIAIALESFGYGPITVTNRTLEKAETLARALTGGKAISLEQAEVELDKYNIIIQTTNVGMEHSVGGMPLDPHNVSKDAIVADIIYNPLETMFLRNAKHYGAKTLNGLGMFVHQGATAFELWTEKRPNTQEMIQKLTEQLGGTLC